MKIKFTFLVWIILFIYSCSDCPIERDPENQCNVRSSTINEFDPRLTKINDTTLVPVPEYSIHTFQFPSDNSSSGNFPNDDRFTKSEKIIVAQRTFPNPSGGDDLKAVIYDVYPSNSSIIGDIMVVDVTIDPNPLQSTALLRFYGTVGRFPKDFPSEDANKFCQEYLKSHTSDDLDNIRKSASRYGQSLPNAQVATYDQSDIVVLNSKNEVVTGVSVPSNISAELVSQAQSNAIDIRVKPGEVFYYRARNGQEFAIAISDIRVGTYDPLIKRVSIQFSAINQ